MKYFKNKPKGGLFLLFILMSSLLLCPHLNTIRIRGSSAAYDKKKLLYNVDFVYILIRIYHDTSKRFYTMKCLYHEKSAAFNNKRRTNTR